jgi:hypothetical protein
LDQVLLRNLSNLIKGTSPTVALLQKLTVSFIHRAVTKEIKITSSRYEIPTDIYIWMK